MAIKKNNELTLFDRLSRLDYRSACALLGGHGAELVRGGGAHEIDIDAQVSLDARRFRLQIPARRDSGEAVVTLSLVDDARRRLRWRCSACEVACDHVGAAFALVLEEKLALGLAAPPVDVRSEVVARSSADRDTVAAAGGELLAAAFRFISEVVPDAPASPSETQVSDALRQQLERCVQADAAGRLQLTVTLPDPAVLDGFARSLGRLLATARADSKLN
jgi:hypothetical protein